MSTEQLNAFLEAVETNAGLQEKLKTATKPEEVVTIANAAGFMISKDELAGATDATSGKLTDGELEGVVGGNLKPTGPILCS